MILTLALRSLTAHPARTAVLALGFGLGVAAMATLLGVGEVILEQARAPVLRGGGDLKLGAVTGAIGSPRFLLSSVLLAPPLASRVAVAAPSRRARLYVVHEGRVVDLVGRGGIPSLERALGDPELASVPSWVDTPADRAWSAPDPGEVLREMDRFHPVPDVPARAGSWAEWLYFNGQAASTRFYLSFIVGPRRETGSRTGAVRLQLDRGGVLSNYSAVSEVDEATLLAEAPDVTIGANRVRLRGLRYSVSLDLGSEGATTRGRRQRVIGDLFIDAVPGRSMPPFTVRGAGGWQSGYVVPVMSGALGGTLLVDGERVDLDRGRGYHDHNWGFWQGVSWRWGQVEHGGLSFVYGRLHPPPDAADPDRMPGFLAALGPQGPLGYSTQVSIEETNDPNTGRPRQIVVRGRGSSLDLTMDLTVEDVVVNRLERLSAEEGMDFLQLRARYRVVGRAGGETVDFTAAGAAETFRGR
jgi:hypothetical protein